MRQVTTLALIEEGDQILLAMKKRGFGEGWWNGYGGKVTVDETVEESMVRELEEESGLKASEWRKRGLMEFHFQGTGDIVEMHIFEVTEYEGELVETEEMAPKWFPRGEIPYEQMWPSDRDWHSLYLAGKDFEGKATFDAATKKFLKSDVKVVERTK